MRRFRPLLGSALLMLAALDARPACHEDLCSPAALHDYGILLASTEFGKREESAAWVVRGTDGCLHLMRWVSKQELMATYRGIIPPGSLAVVHTHPSCDPKPSPHDVAEAERINMPIIALTIDAVMIARTDGTIETLAGKGWRNGK